MYNSANQLYKNRINVRRRKAKNNQPNIFKTFEYLYHRANDAFYYMINMKKRQLFNIKLLNNTNKKYKQVRFSTCVRVMLIPTKSELLTHDLWWSNDIYSNNKSYIDTIRRNIIRHYPFITKQELKDKVMVEINREPIEDSYNTYTNYNQLYI